MSAMTFTTMGDLNDASATLGKLRGKFGPLLMVVLAHALMFYFIYSGMLSRMVRVDQLVMVRRSLLAAIPVELPVEITDILASGKGVRIERIVSRGHHGAPDSWYDQDQDEWVLLVRGAAILQFARDDTSLFLSPGMYVHIAAHEKHRVQWTSEDEDTIWLAVFY